MSPPPGLQPERTALAWRRLALALVAAGLLASHLVVARRPGWAAVTSLGATVVALVLLVVSQLDLAGGSHDQARRTPVGELILTAVVVVLLAAAGLVLALG